MQPEPKQERELKRFSGRGKEILDAAWEKYLIVADTVIKMEGISVGTGGQISENREGVWIMKNKESK
jgi:hypothetical protein